MGVQGHTTDMGKRRARAELMLSINGSFGTTYEKKVDFVLRFLWRQSPGLFCVSLNFPYLLLR